MVLFPNGFKRLTVLTQKKKKKYRDTQMYSKVVGRGDLQRSRVEYIKKQRARAGLVVGQAALATMGYIFAATLLLLLAVTCSAQYAPGSVVLIYPAGLGTC